MSWSSFKILMRSRRKKEGRKEERKKERKKEKSRQCRKAVVLSLDIAKRAVWMLCGPGWNCLGAALRW